MHHRIAEKCQSVQASSSLGVRQSERFCVTSTASRDGQFPASRRAWHNPYSRRGTPSGCRASQRFTADCRVLRSADGCAKYGPCRLPAVERRAHAIKVRANCCILRACGEVGCPIRRSRRWPRPGRVGGRKRPIDCRHRVFGAKKLASVGLPGRENGLPGRAGQFSEAATHRSGIHVPPA